MIVSIELGKLNPMSLTLVLIQSLGVTLVRSRKIDLKVHGSGLGELVSLFPYLIWGQRYRQTYFQFRIIIRRGLSLSEDTETTQRSPAWKLLISKKIRLGVGLSGLCTGL